MHLLFSRRTSPLQSLCDKEPGNKVVVCACVLSHVWLCDLMATARQALLSMGLSWEEYWSGWPLPPPGDLPNSGIEPRPPSWEVDSLPDEPPEKPKYQKIFENNPYIFKFNVTFTKRDHWLSHWSRNKEQRSWVCIWWHKLFSVELYGQMGIFIHGRWEGK